MPILVQANATRTGDEKEEVRESEEVMSVITSSHTHTTDSLFQPISNHNTSSHPLSSLFSLVKMDTNRLKPTIPDSSEGEFAKLEVAWERIFPQEPTTEMKGDSFLYAILDVFLNELRTLILAPNNLDYVSDPGNVIKDWDNTTYFSVINAIGRGFREKDWQSFVNLGILRLPTTYRRLMTTFNPLIEIVRSTDVSSLPMTSGVCVLYIYKAKQRAQ